MKAAAAALLRKTRSLARRIRKLFRAAVRDDYQDRVENELKNFAQLANVHELPMIFHYWSNKYLAPKLNNFGITDPEHFYFLYVQKLHDHLPDRP